MLFQIAALLILAAFYGCYFGKMLRQKQQGIQTDQIGKGKRGKALMIEIVMKIVTLAAPVAELVSILLGTALLPVWARILGLILGGLGVAVFVCSVVTMKDSWRAGVSSTEKTSLVTCGIYQISRNPAFLGFDLVYAGILLAFFNWVLLGVSVMAIMILHIQIVFVEEPFLLERFGGEYLDYQKKVFRYLGRRAG